MYKTNAAEQFFLCFHQLIFIFYFFGSRIAELLIRVTAVTSKFERRTQGCLLIPSPLSLSQRDVSGATFHATSSSPIQEVLNSAYR